jgi:hypothetical protein
MKMSNLQTNNYIFNDWGNLIRTRKWRSKYREIIVSKDKKLIGKYKNDQALRKTKLDLPLVDLNPPIQKGWKRYFILREDVRRSKVGPFFENLLQKINTTQYSPTKDFKKKKRKMGRKIYLEKEQKLKTFYPWEIPKLKLSEKEMAFFTQKIEVKTVAKKVVEMPFFEITEAWRFTLRIRPNIIDKVRVFDNELEQKLAESNNYLYQNIKNRARLSKLRDWGGFSSWHDGIEKLKYDNPIKNTPLWKILD